MPLFRLLRTLCLPVLASALLLAVSAPPAAAQLVRSASGPNAAAIQPSVDQFRTDLGALNPNVVGSFNTGRREINWDGVPDAFAAPNNLPANFFNVNSPRGVLFSTPGTGFQVSANAVNPTATPVRFGNIDPNYPSFFATFSAQRLFTALGSTVTDVSFFVPGTSTPALTRGFGSVFTDVDAAGSTSIQYFDQNGISLGILFVPPAAGDQTLSFLGVSFPDPVVSRVRVTSGNQVLAPGNTAPDLVVMDDFIYGEPQLVPTTLQFSSPSYSVGESGPVATITITRTSTLGAPVSVDFATVNGTAIGGVDFVPVATTVPFIAGQAAATVDVPIINDGLSEGTENFFVTLSNPQPPGFGLLGAPTLAVVTILDNDLAPTLSINNVTQAEGNTGTTPFVFTVTLSGPSASTVIVNFQTADGTATAGVDYLPQSGQLFFPAGSTSQNITVPVIGETAFEGSETFFVDLTAASGITPPPPPNVRATGTILNDDAAPTVRINDVQVREGNTATFTVTLSAAAGADVLVDFATANGTAIAGQDYESRTGTLTIPAGQTTGSIDIQTLQDEECEFPAGTNETFFVNLSNARAQTSPTTALTITDAQGIGTICDDDGPARLELTRIGSATVVLGAAPVPTSFRATVFNGCGDRLNDVPITFTVTGANPAAGTLNTDTNGEAVFTFTLRLPGASQVRARAEGGCNPTAGPITVNAVLPPTLPGQQVRVVGTGTIGKRGPEGLFNVSASKAGGRVGGVSTYFDYRPIFQSQVRSVTIDAIAGAGNRAAVFGRALLQRPNRRDRVAVFFRADYIDNGRGEFDEIAVVVVPNGGGAPLIDQAQQRLLSGNVEVRVRP